MSYVSSKTRNKMVHTASCRYTKMMNPKNKKYFYSLEQASKEGFVRCKYCDKIAGMMRSEKGKIDVFSQMNGLYPTYSREDGTLDIISPSGKWKVIANGKKQHIWLYHKNTYATKEKGLVPGYHSQKVKRSSLMDYMKYIVQHDEYRDEVPAEEFKNIPKGKKARKKQERRIKALKRRQSIRYVISLLDNMSAGVLAY